jgi:hypothetical protein
MNDMKKISSTPGYVVVDGANIPNPVLLSQQIDDLRKILRRMKASSMAAGLDPVISKKLEKLTKN